jgi:hypothetical protein
MAREVVGQDLGRRYHDDMATPEKACIEIEGELLERARQAANERGVGVPQLVHDASKHEIVPSAPTPTGDEGDQPTLTCIGIGGFGSGRGDLSKLASEDVFEPEPFR